MKKTSLGFIIFLTGILNFSNIIVANDKLHIITALFTALVVGICLPLSRGINRLIGITLFSVGILLLVMNEAPITEWYEAFLKNGSILTILIIVPMIGIVFQNPYYIASIEKIIKKNLDSNHTLYLSLFSVTHLLSLPLNFASISLGGNFISANIIQKTRQRTAYTAIARGYTSILLWSPSTGSMALVLHWGAEWNDIALPGLVLVGITLFIGWLMESLRLAKITRGENHTVTEPSPQPASDVKADGLPKLSTLVLVLGLILGLIMALDVFTKYKTLVSISIVALFFPLFWFLFIKKIKDYTHEAISYSNGLARITNEMVIFIGAGFFATAMAQSKFSSILPVLFKGTKDSPILFVSLMATLIIILAILGVHPVLTVTSLSTAINPIAYGFSPAFIALAAIAWWSLALTASPVSVCSLRVSSLAKESPINVSLKWNYAYVFILFVVYTLVFYLLWAYFGY